MNKEIINGSHRETYIGKKYFEWWYFHFVSQEITANLVLHETDIFGLNKDPYMSLTILEKGMEPRYCKKGLSKDSIKNNSLFLETASENFIEDKEKIRINIDFGESQFNVDIQKKTPPVVINNGILYQDDHGKSMWLVQVPVGDLNGSLMVDGRNIELSGVAYQDHQWGNLKIQDFVSQWVWGHLSNKDQNYVFFHILTRDNKIVDRVILGSSTEIQTFTDLKTASLDDFSHAPDFYEKPYNLNFLLPNNKNLNISISPSELMRSRISEKHSNFISTYLRWASENEKLSGLIEYLRIEK